MFPVVVSIIPHPREIAELFVNKLGKTAAPRQGAAQVMILSTSALSSISPSVAADEIPVRTGHPGRLSQRPNFGVFSSRDLHLAAMAVVNSAGEISTPKRSHQMITL